MRFMEEAGVLAPPHAGPLEPQPWLGDLAFRFVCRQPSRREHGARTRRRQPETGQVQEAHACLWVEASPR